MECSLILRILAAVRQADFSKGLLPAIVQDSLTGKVLMLGYMNAIALQQTMDTGHVTFFSRSRNALWTKGETSGNFLKFCSYRVDCDSDAILIKAQPIGPTCHEGTDTCWAEQNIEEFGFLLYLEKLIQERKRNPQEGSYTNHLFGRGLNKIAQKVGEEAVELVIEAKDDNDELFKNEAADLIFHFLVLLAQKNIALDEILQVLQQRHAK
jgi:phosphoribosyl-AMP cyclohydrolase / phosphoribosyl-ATP pyrophosphohydrolase